MIGEDSVFAAVVVVVVTGSDAGMAVASARRRSRDRTRIVARSVGGGEGEEGVRGAGG